MANNKAKYEVQVDIDVTSGKVNADKLLADVEKQVTSKIKASKVGKGGKRLKVGAPIEFDTTKILQDIKSVGDAQDKQFQARIKQVENLRRENSLTYLEAKKQIDDLSFLRNEEFLRTKKLTADLARVVETASNKEAVAIKRTTTERIKNATSLDVLRKKTNLVGDAIKNAFKVGKTEIKGFGDLLGKVTVEMAKAAGSGFNFGNAMQGMSNKTEAAKKAVKELLAEGRNVSRSFSAAFGGGAKDKKDRSLFGPNLGQREAGRAKVKARPAEVKSDLTNMASAMALAGKQQNAMSLGLAKVAEALRKQRALLESKGIALKESTALVNAAAKAEKELAAAQQKTTLSADLKPASRISALNAEQASIEKNIIAQGRLRAAAIENKKSTAEFDAKLLKLNRALKATERALRGPTKTMQEFANSLKTFVRFAVAFKVLGGISRGVRALVTNVLALDDALVSVKTIANATADEMIAVENAVKNVATTTQFTTTEIAQAAQVLAQAGVGPESIASTLSAVANFAAATNASLQVAADLISTIQNVFKELAPEEIADKLTNAVNISKLTATGLQTIFSRLAQTAKSFNLDFDQILGAAAVLKNVGIKDSTISTGFRQGLLELLSPDDKTLKVLEKRYKAVGETMSQSAISSLFSSFQNDANPLLRVLDELEKLGIQGSGAEDFERLFDVRASNVINALIDNKEQFVKNTEAIGRTGAAAKGAKTQLESLTKGLDNLVAVVSTLAADLSGPLVDGLNSVVGTATNAANSLRDMFNAQKELTGSSGLGASLQLGLSAGAAAASGGLGAGKSVIAGLLSAGIATAVNANSGKAQGVTESATNALTTVLETVATLSIIRTFFPEKEISRLTKAKDGLKSFIKNPKTSLKSALSALAVGVGKIPLIIGAVAGGVVLVSSLLKDFFDSSLEESLANISQRRDALGKRIEDNKAAIADAEKDFAAVRSNEKSDAAASRKVGLIDEAIDSVVDTVKDKVLERLIELDKKVKERRISVENLDNVLNDMFRSPGVKREELKGNVREVFESRVGVTKDVGSDAFDKINKDINSELEALGANPVTKQQSVKILIQQDNLIAEAEGRRLLFIDNLIAAQANSQDPDNKDLLDAWAALSAAEVDRYRTSVSGVEQAREFIAQTASGNKVGSAELIAAEEKLQKLRKELSDNQAKELQLQVDAIKAAAKSRDRSLFGASFDELFDSFSSLSGAAEAIGQVFVIGGKGLIEKAEESLEEAQNLARAEVNKGKSKLNTAIQSGLVEQSKKIAEALLKVYAISIEEAKAAVDAATANAEATARKEIRAQIKSIAEGRRVESKVTPLGKPAEEDKVSVKESSARDKASRDTAIKAENELKDSLVKILKAKLEAVGDEEKLTALKKQQTVIEAKILDQAVRIQNLGSSLEKDAEKVKQIKQGFLFEELRVKELTKQIGDAKALELRDEEKFTGLLTERLALEKKTLQAAEKALTQSIKNELGRKGKEFKSDNLSGLLSEISASQILATKGYEGLAGLVKEAVQVQDKLNLATSRYTDDLDNYLRKDLNGKLTKAQTKLTANQTETSNLESKLTRATDKLIKSREDLADEYDKQVEDELFFQQINREFDGEDATQKGDAKDLLARSAAAGSNEEAISLAKEAISTAKTLFDQGDISKSQAGRLKDKGIDAIREARSSEIRIKQEDVNRRVRERKVIAAQLETSLASREALQLAVDGLKTSIDTLPARIAAALAALKPKGAGADAEGSSTITKSVDDKGNVTYSNVGADASNTGVAGVNKSVDDKGNVTYSNVADKLEASAEKVGDAGKSLSSSAKESSDSAKSSAAASNNSLTASANKLNSAATDLSTAAGRLAVARSQNPNHPGFANDGIDDASSGGGGGTVNFIKDIGKKVIASAKADTANVSLQASELSRYLSYAGPEASRKASDAFKRDYNESNGFSVTRLSKSSVLESNAKIDARGYSTGGLITGPGNGKDDKAGNFALSDNEFVQPSKATEFYGQAFMEQVRSLRFPVDAVRGTPSAGTTPVGSNQSGAEALAKASGGNNKLRPVTLNVGGSKFSSNASDESISSFRKSLSMQALKAGTK